MVMARPYRDNPETDRNAFEKAEVNGFTIMYHWFKPYNGYILKIADEKKYLRVISLNDNPANTEEAFAKACELAGKKGADLAQISSQIFDYTRNTLNIENADEQNPQDVEDNLRRFEMAGGTMNLTFNPHFGYVIIFPAAVRFSEYFGSYGANSFNVGYNRILANSFFSEMVGYIERLNLTGGNGSSITPEKAQKIKDRLHKLVDDAQKEYSRLD